MGAGPKAGGSLAMARCLACGLQPARPPAPGPQAGGSRARGHRHGMRPSASQGADLARRHRRHCTDGTGTGGTDTDTDDLRVGCGPAK